MYEFHGWAVLWCGGDDEQHARNVHRLETEFRAYLCEVAPEPTWRLFEQNVVTIYNISGIHNHPRNYVLESFQWIADRAPRSYGLLYLNDDEQTPDAAENFVAWRLAKGELTKHPDPFLSPRFPTIE